MLCYAMLWYGMYAVLSWQHLQKKTAGECVGQRWYVVNYSSCCYDDEMMGEKLHL